MKTTLGKLRQLVLAEALKAPPMSDKDKAFSRGHPHQECIDSHDGFSKGEWVMVRNKFNGSEYPMEIAGFTVTHRRDKEPYLSIRLAGALGGHSNEKRYDLWKTEDYVGPATQADIDAEMERAEKARAREAGMIDTSREGT